MKVIDLLNKIANGEEVPKKIKYCNQVFELTENKVDWYCYDYAINFLGNEIGIFNLNDEVEIIEEHEEEPKEHKIPEKLGYQDNANGTFYLNRKKYNSEPIKILSKKINEILDYLEEIE